jgi:thiosulfate reductase cytochrome b subunit
MATVLIHPLIVRITHWINVLAVLLMITSGWAIYNASPLFGFEFPYAITLGGWLAGALLWHFAGMWLFALNGLLYLAYGIASPTSAPRCAAIWRTTTSRSTTPRSGLRTSH